jgi:hypothetical protein
MASEIAHRCSSPEEITPRSRSGLSDTKQIADAACAGWRVGVDAVFADVAVTDQWRLTQRVTGGPGVVDVGDLGAPGAILDADLSAKRLPSPFRASRTQLRTTRSRAGDAIIVIPTCGQSPALGYGACGPLSSAADG